MTRRKEAATHCSSSRLTGHRSQTLHHISSQHWCTSHCCTWIQRICRAGGKLHKHNNISNMSQQVKTFLLFKLDSGFSLFFVPVRVDYVMSLLSFSISNSGTFLPRLIEIMIFRCGSWISLYDPGHNRKFSSIDLIFHRCSLWKKPLQRPGVLHPERLYTLIVSSYVGRLMTSSDCRI